MLGRASLQAFPSKDRSAAASGAIRKPMSTLGSQEDAFLKKRKGGRQGVQDSRGGGGMSFLSPSCSLFHPLTAKHFTRGAGPPLPPPCPLPALCLLPVSRRAPQCPSGAPPWLLARGLVITNFIPHIKAEPARMASDSQLPFFISRSWWGHGGLSVTFLFEDMGVCP